MDPQFDFSDGSGGGGMGGGMNGGGMGAGGGYGAAMNTGMGFLNQYMQGGGMQGSFMGGQAGGGSKNWQNPANSAMPYLNQMMPNITPYFDPYINAGAQALPQLQQQYGQDLSQGNNLRSQYSQMMNNPGGVMNRIGSGFQQSPGYQFQTQQAMGAANRTAAAGGMLGTPAEQQSIAGTVGGLANQDYYNYLNHGMQMYGQGLQGEQGMYNQGIQGNQDMTHMGLGASNSLTDDVMSQYMSQANLAYAGTSDQDQNKGGSGGSGSGMLGGAASGAMAGSAFGPYGMIIGAGVGALGSYFSSK